MDYGAPFKKVFSILSVLAHFVVLIGTIQGQEESNYDVRYIPLPTLNANRNVSDVFQDRYGILWIGSTAGLYRHDGVNTALHRLFRDDSVFCRHVRSIREDTEGNLWVGMENGLKILNPARSSLLPLARFGLPDSLATVPVSVEEGPGNSLYIAAGIHIFQNKHRKTALKRTLQIADNYNPISMYYNKADDCLSLLAPESRRHYFMVIHADGQVVNNPPIYNTFPIEVGRQSFTKYMGIRATADSIIFCSSYATLQYDKRRRCFIPMPDDPASKRFSNYNRVIEHFIQKNKESLPLDTSGFAVRWIRLLSDDTDVVISTEGVFIVQLKHIAFHPVKASLGKRIRAIQVDRSGRLMYGTYPDLVWQYPEEKEVHILTKNWLTWIIQPIDTGRTRFFLGAIGTHTKTWLSLQSSSNKLLLRQSSKFTSPPDLIEDIGTSSISAANDTFREGIWHFLHGRNCFQIVFYNWKTDRHYFLNLVQFDSEPRGAIAGKDLWLGGAEGLKRFVEPDPYSGLLKEDNSIIPAAIQNLSVLCMYPDANGGIWFGADGKGLFRYQPETAQYELFTSADGLPDNSVFSIIGESGDSVLWLGTGNGLSRLNVRERRFVNFSREDGLTNHEFNTAAACRTPEGIIYMGGQNGIIRFDPNRFDIRSVNLKQLAQVRVAQRNGKAEEQVSFLSDGAMLRIPPDVSLIRITFHTDDYIHAEKQYYRYRIPGLIDVWQTLNYSDQAIFSYLPPGRHTIEVQAQTYRKMWTPSVFYTLDVLPPWYKTWWFILLVVLLTGAALYSLYVFRIRHLRREFELRQQISHDLHDSLGSRIYLLRSLSNQIANPLLSDKEKNERLGKFESISQDAFQSIRDFIWAFDPKQDQVSQLFDRMDDFAENYLSPLVPEVKVHRVDPSIDLKIDPKTKHHLINIYQELLTNMVKHTHTTAIEVSLNYQGEYLHIDIRNWHKGYQQEGKGSETLKAGHESLTNRLKSIRAQLNWWEPTDQLQQAQIKIKV